MDSNKPPKCLECGSVLMLTSLEIQDAPHLVCPNGHGKLLPLPIARRDGEVYLGKQKRILWRIAGSRVAGLFITGKAGEVIALRPKSEHPRITRFIPAPKGIR